MRTTACGPVYVNAKDHTSTHCVHASDQNCDTLAFDATIDTQPPSDHAHVVFDDDDKDEVPNMSIALNGAAMQPPPYTAGKYVCDCTAANEVSADDDDE